MEASQVPEWKKALLERKRAKRAATDDGLSLSRLLELYSAMPGVRTIRADRIVIIETCPGEAAQRRVPGAAELRAEQVVVYEPQPGHVRRLRHQFDPVRPRIRRCGAPGRKEASDGLLRMRGTSGDGLRMCEGRQAVSADQLRMSKGQMGASGCPLRIREGRYNTAEKPMDAWSSFCQSEESGVPLRMPERQSERAKEASSGTLRMVGGQLAAPPFSQYVQKIAANSFLVNPRGRRAIDPKERATDPRGGGAWHSATVPTEKAWPASPDSTVPKKSAWPDAKVHKERAWPPSPDGMVPKERAWPPSPDSMVPRERAWPPLLDATVPKEITWPPLPDSTYPKESTRMASEWCATNPEGGTRPASPKGPGRRTADLEEPYYRSQERPHTVSPRGPEPHPTNSSLQDATDPRGCLRGAIATGTVAPPVANLAPSPGASLRQNSRNSFRVVPRPPRGVPAPQENDRVPVTCIDEETTTPLAPLKVLSPRLEGCDVPYDSSLAPDSEDAALGSGFESTLLHNGTREAPGPKFECAFPRSRYPCAEEIEVIGGYLSLDRSCMSKGGARRRKKLKISFDDTRLHTMFEYPSENSLAADEQEEEAEGEEEEEEEYASEVDEAPPLPSPKRAAPSGRPYSGFSSYTPKSPPGEGGSKFKEAPQKVGTVAPGADSPDNHVMLTPAGAGALSDFSSEPALYF